jgi:CRISPR-associated endonuclease/helicase Cas3
MSNKGIFWAHSNKSGNKELLAEHLRLVSERADQYAGAIGASDEAHVAGLLHDLGKYGELFQRRLEGKETGIDHWSAGAWEALVKLKDKGIASALCIQGHHIGLQIGSKESLRKLNPRSLQASHPPSLRISEADSDKLIEYFQNDGLILDTMDAINSSVTSFASRVSLRPSRTSSKIN